MNNVNRIGIFGGTFDPVHIGHLRVALHIFEEFNLNQIRFIPAGNPPNKINKIITDSSLRLKMIRDAIHPWSDHFIADDIEIRRDGASYMIETVDELKNNFPDSEFFLLLGNDNVIDLPNWKNWKKLLNEVCVISFKKDSTDFPLPEEMTEFKNRFMISKAPLFEISSTEIRNRISHKKNVDLLVTESVLRIIQTNNLYRNMPS